MLALLHTARIKPLDLNFYTVITQITSQCINPGRDCLKSCLIMGDLRVLTYFESDSTLLLCNKFEVPLHWMSFSLIVKLLEVLTTASCSSFSLLSVVHLFGRTTVSRLQNISWELELKDTSISTQETLQLSVRSSEMLWQTYVLRKK